MGSAHCGVQRDAARREQLHWAAPTTICTWPKHWFAADTSPDRKTDMLAANLAAYQGGDGGWHLPGYARSPLQDNDFSRTAMAIRALKTYGTPGRAAETKERIERAKQWLLHANAVTTEDLDMRLAGVAAAGASAAELRKLAEPILATPAARRWICPARQLRQRRLRHRYDAVGARRCQSHSAQPGCVPERCPIPAGHSECRWLLARLKPGDEIPDLL